MNCGQKERRGLREERGLGPPPLGEVSHRLQERTWNKMRLPGQPPKGAAGGRGEVVPLAGLLGQGPRSFATQSGL